jgi:hypothetical protein
VATQAPSPFFVALPKPSSSEEAITKPASSAATTESSSYEATAHPASHATSPLKSPPVGAAMVKWPKYFYPFILMKIEGWIKYH